MNNDQDLAVEAFLTLRELFFDVNAMPHSFNLRDKGITQDDPFDEYQEFTVQDPFATVQNERQGMRGRLELGISIITELPPEQSDDIALEPGEPT